MNPVPLNLLSLLLMQSVMMGVMGSLGRKQEMCWEREDPASVIHARSYPPFFYLLHPLALLRLKACYITGVDLRRSRGQPTEGRQQLSQLHTVIWQGIRGSQ